MAHDRALRSSYSPSRSIGMKFVQQQFFPPSPTGLNSSSTSLAAERLDRRDQSRRWTASNASSPATSDVDSWSSYVGQGAIRFVLAFDVQIANPSYGQIIIVTKDVAARDRLRTQLKDMAHREFVGIDVQVELLPIGPPAGRPVQYRVSGPDVPESAANSRSNWRRTSAPIRLLDDVGFNWMEPARVVKLEVLQDKARQLGVTSEAIAQTMNSVVGGAHDHAGS